MNEPTKEQIEAVQYLDGVSNGSKSGPAWQTIRALLSPDLTNPQPVLPTEPGWYLATDEQSPSGKIAIELLNTGEWVDNTDSRYLQVSWVAELTPLTRLVPEHPQVTRQELIDLLSSTINFSNGYRADQILALLARNSA